MDEKASLDKYVKEFMYCNRINKDRYNRNPNYIESYYEAKTK